MRATATPKIREQKKIAVTEVNVRKAGTRLLSSSLVSTEIAYVQRILGAQATQDALDAKVLAVRSMPWASIVIPD
ncbi:MAG TPA: hypothetical protein VEK11_20180 [Thermoanaerobaculia bacterium]|nr:hypothetical protein [Thermoanaerobaculia bacterium]